MTQVLRRARALALAASLALLAGCGAGGFESTVPERTVGPITFDNYVALGDGFASGPYLGRDVSGTGCLRSADNYPTQVARALQVRTLTDVTCLGATTKELTSTGTPPRSDRRLTPQLDAVTQDTDLVTIGIGIEDSGLLRGMFQICPREPCDANDVLFPSIAQQLDAFGDAFTNAVRTIQDVAPRATILIVGYPQIMPPTGLCPALPKISEEQLGFSFKILELLNSFLRSTAFQTGASFIDVADVSRDHALCSNDPWVNGSTTTRGKVQAFHPTAAEQRAVAEEIAAQVRIASASQPR